MDQDAAAAQAGERRERPVGAVERHVAHAPAGLVAGAGRDHLVVDEERGVEQNNVGAVAAAGAASAWTAAAPGT